ncbi:signal protein [Silvibacterium dinghuense]|uniref:Signal protein n=1 Tax=Silvibacterium dinghuense TaxID=1560006 RepID=A0A4V1NUW8_9BACT|nr:signal protein [Silvibacterium dinghuense]RXS93704.1 signal protein [Silvibacterium dinghuense]GGH06997.1 hypothetical protein GCM10011586_23990 [Silvibacterium dinghuense]
MRTLRILALCSVVSTGMLFAQTAATPAPAASTHAAKATAAAPAPDAAAIADAKSKGLVWVNLNTKVYHQSSAKQYGATKNGKFMTEADAKAAGYRAAKDGGAKAAKPAAGK